MRKLILILLLTPAILKSNTYFLSPSGSDSNLGTMSSPWFTLQKAWTVINSGDTIYMRGGMYNYSIQQYLTGKNGTNTDKIVVLNYPNETPAITRTNVFTKPGNYWHRGMVFFSGNYFVWKGIRFTGMYTDDNQVDSGFLVYDANNCVFEQLECDNNVQGMYMQNDCTGNLIVNCDFHDNYSNYNNSNGGNSDGLGLSYMLNPSTNNTVRGCRAWNNGDDGFDTFENLGYVLIENCWSFHNGYYLGTYTDAGDGVGFKLGSDFINTQTNILKRRLQNCIAFDNANSGIHINEAEYKTEVYNCTFYNNAVMNMNFHYGNSNHTFRNVISFLGGNTDVEISSNSSSSNCSYGSSGNSDAVSGWINNVTNADFVNLSYSGVNGARQSNGNLPIITFLHLASGSSLIDSGTNVGLPYNGSAPDRGAFEFGPAANIPPTAVAGSTIYLTLPSNSVAIPGSASDSDGSITSYTWTQQSGPNSASLTNANTPTLAASSLTIGTYVFRLTVTDNMGATGFDDVTVIVNSNPPSVAITSPTVNATVSGTVTINANATDAIGINHVNFHYVDTIGSFGTTFSDNFNRTTSTNLGSNWTERYTASNYQINANQLRLNTNDGNITVAYTSNGITSANYAVEATISFPSLSSVFAGIGARMSNSGTNDVDGYMLYAEPGAQEIYIYKRVNGTWTQLSSFQTPIAANTAYTAKLDVNGNTIKAYWNNNLAMTVNDNSFSNAGYAGVTTGTGYNVTNINWDDFSISTNNYTVNTVFIGSDNTSPYSVVWNTNTLPNGIYSLLAKAYNNINDSASSALVNVIVNNSVATHLNSMDNIAINVFPNPADNKISIKTELSNMESIIVYDISGKVVITADNINNKQYILNIENLNHGCYILRCLSTNKTWSNCYFIKN